MAVALDAETGAEVSIEDACDLEGQRPYFECSRVGQGSSRSVSSGASRSRTGSPGPRAWATPEPGSETCAAGRACRVS